MEIATKRLVWADIARVLAIYLVIVVHTESSPQVLPMLGVPIFVMLSGALLLGKSENYSEFWSKRLVRLLRPWIFWALVISIFDIFVNKTSFNLLFSYFRSNFITIWFLPMIFGLYLLTPALRIFVKYAKARDLWIVIALWFLTISVLPFFRNTSAFPLFSDNGFVRQVMQFLGYYLLGYAITKQKQGGKMAGLLFIVIGLLITEIMGRSGTFVLYYQAPGIVLIAYGLFRLLFDYRNNFQKLITGKYSSFLAAVSKTSLGVYLLQGMILAFLPISDPSGGWFKGAILFGLSTSVVFLLQKIPILGRWAA